MKGERMADLFDRMKRAAMLDSQLYEEVEADQGALGQATLVVVLSSLGRREVGSVLLPGGDPPESSGARLRRS